MKEGKYYEAAKELQPLANGGDAEAQYLAATLFFEGKGVNKQSDEQGIKYATLSANQGYGDAVCLLYDYYLQKENQQQAYEILQNYTERFPSLLKEKPGYCLAICYLKGYGVAADTEKAWEIIKGNQQEADFKKEYHKEYINYISEKYQREIREFEKNNPDVVSVAYSSPSFPGGAQAMNAWIYRNLRYPVLAQEEGIQGRVIIYLVVEKDGSIGYVNISRSVDPILDQEAIRVVKAMPKWIPGKGSNGRPVRTSYTLPITFRLQ